MEAIDAAVQNISNAYFKKCSSIIRQHQQRGSRETTFLRKIMSGFQTVDNHSRFENQEKALLIIPVDLIHERTEKRMAGATVMCHSESLVRELLHWFKNEFFKWVNTVDCERCKSKTTSAGADRPTHQELQFGASVVELHKCPGCGFMNRFPRYNDPVKLLETRGGRCGEWANCFGLVLTAMGLENRYVLDFTDHVWNEIQLEPGVWKHCDSCENSFDNPLMYEAGWGKKLNYVFSFRKHQIVDSTRRYSAKYKDDVLSRRDMLLSETHLYLLLQQLNQEKRQTLAIELREEIEKDERAELEGDLLVDAKRIINPEALVPRQSGSLNWRMARGEMG